MAFSRMWLVSLGIVGCTFQSVWSTQQLPPARGIPFRPETAWEWPLWPTRDGWLIGGSGYVTGLAGPLGVTPGLGLGGLLIPSRRAGSWLGFAGPYPTPAPLAAPSIVWQAPQSVPSPSSPRESWAFSKMGPIPMPEPLRLPLPDTPYLPTSWGPVSLQTGPMPRQSPFLSLGFPPADGTPVAMTPFIPWFQFHEGAFDVTLLDRKSRQVHRPPALRNLPGAVTIGYYPPTLLIGPVLQTGHLTLFDLATGSQDPLPEIPEVLPLLALGGSTLSQRGEFIVFQGEESGRPRIHVFDRRLRFVNRLEHLNASVADPRHPAIDPTASQIAYSFFNGRDRDIAIYDLLAGRTLPLPEANTSADESVPSLSASGQVVTFITDEAGPPQARLYDRSRGMLDRLPEVNGLGTILACAISPDAFELFVIYQAPQQVRIAVYDRRNGMIDELPELNLPGVNQLP